MPAASARAGSHQRATTCWPRLSTTITWACCSLLVGCGRPGSTDGAQASWSRALEGRAAAAAGVPNLAADRFFQARRAAAANIPDTPTHAAPVYRRIRDFGMLEAAEWCRVGEYGYAALALQATIADLGGEGVEDSAERPVDTLRLLVQTCRDLAGEQIDLGADWQRFRTAAPDRALSHVTALVDAALSPYDHNTYASGPDGSSMGVLLHRLAETAKGTAHATAGAAP
ncbi:MAG: hypothetical protein HY696_05170 [Deltaproteobacteria bacterium]|nr:hypothetical protein [Deltaproteobacteria bacterium]